MLRRDNLLQESMQRSGGGEYMMASKAYSQIATVRENEMTHRKDTETKRQGSERVKLEESYRIESERFEVEWAQKMKAVEERCRLRLVELTELHEISRENLERDIAHKVKGMRYKNSSYLLGLEDIERRLALAKEFNGAHEMAAKARKQRKMEEEAHQKKVDAQGAQPRAALKVAQIEEERNITQKCHGWRVEARRQQGKALEVLKQKFRNLEADISHAFAIEFNLQAEIGPVQTHKSRSTQASTFRGTLKRESLVGTKFDVPDVTRMPGFAW